MPRDDVAERTEKATPRKLRQAREKGQVAKSRDLSSALILLGSILGLKLWGSYTFNGLYRLTAGALGNLNVTTLDIRDAYVYFGRSGLLMIEAVMPIVGALVGIAFLANVVQTGFLITTEPLVPKLTKFNPIEGISSLVSKKGLVRLLASLFKVIVIAVVAYYAISAKTDSFIKLSEGSFAQIAAFGMASTVDVVLKIALALLLLAMFDFAFQKWQYGQDQKMTKKEVSDELKRMEGDPLLRSRRRRMQRELARQRMMHRVPDADVVVTNPTHLAIALQYDSSTMIAPIVVAKGAGLVAERIREIADESDVPIVERKSLAQALFRLCEIDDPVPIDLYQAVAEVLAFVHELNRMKVQQRAGVA